MGTKVAVVGATSVEILNSNPRRKYLLFVNMSSNDIFIKTGAAATALNAVPLYGQGSAWELPTTTFNAMSDLQKFDNDLYMKIYAIASGASSNLSITEVM